MFYTMYRLVSIQDINAKLGYPNNMFVIKHSSSFQRSSDSLNLELPTETAEINVAKKTIFSPWKG